MKSETSECTIYHLSRRDFLKHTGIGLTGLVLGLQFGCAEKKLTGNPNAEFWPNLFIRISGNGDVMLIAHRSEMGTGIRTSLPLILADELEADWTRVKLEQAVGDEKYGDQNTDGSFSMRMFYASFRKAGATARLMLEQAAAKEWHVDVSECKAKNHEVIHTSGKAFGFGYLAEKAAALPIPDEKAITLKEPNDFKYISRETNIFDIKDIVTGQAKFGMDKNLPELKIAVVKRNPEAGAGVVSFNKDAAMKIQGVVDVFTIDAPGFPTDFDKALGGVVVVAANTWSAIKGRDALEIKWAKGINADYDSVKFQQAMLKRAQQTGLTRRKNGQGSSALEKSKKIVEGDFLVPHLAHATMETPCAVAQFDAKADTCQIWAPVQDPQWARGAVAAALGLDQSKITVNVSLLGGGFGRKSKPDFVVEAALISKKTGSPIKLLWTREDDIRHDFYHFVSAQHIKVGIDENNRVNGWLHRSVFPSIDGTVNKNAKQPKNFEIGQGMVDVPFDIANVACETNEASTQIRIGWLRSVANIHHAFAVGCILDEVAEARGLDPVENFLQLLGNDRRIDFESLSPGFWNYNEKIEDFPWDTARFRKVIENVKTKSNWRKNLPSGRGQGFAAHRSFLTYVACVVEVSVEKDHRIIIHKVDYAVDCGVPVNPERIRAQFEGGACFGTSVALKSEITVKNGAVEQNNFNDYFVARITDAPYETAVHIIESQEKPTGVGEPPVPPFIPALCNAIYAATGKRIRQLPIRLT